MGLYLTDLADVLRAAGVEVVEIAGWRSRGYRWHDTPDGGLRSLSGGLVHHTAGPARTATASNYPSLRIVRDGRVDVPGPLAQLGLGFDGTWYVIAAGRANHAGKVDDWRYSNPHALGVEAENPGDGSPWPKVQYASYVTGCAALGDHYSIRWRGHKEAAIPYGRKIDPTFNMDTFRRDLATPTTRDWFDMASDDDLRKIVRAELDRALSGAKVPIFGSLRNYSGSETATLTSMIRYAATSMPDGRNQHADLRARLAGLEAAVRGLAKATGGDVDVDRIIAEIRAAAKEAVKDSLPDEITIPLEG